MRKTYFLITLLLLIIFLAGCQKAAEKAAAEAMEEQLEAETGGDVEVNVEDESVTIETEEGTIQATGVEGDEWCQEGTEWSFTSSAPESQANAQWIIKGLVASGEYAGLCHVEYRVEAQGKVTTIDYYFEEDGADGYFEMEMNGQKVKQELHSD